LLAPEPLHEEHFAGTVKEIIIKNEMSVEFDEPLVIIDIS